MISQGSNSAKSIITIAIPSGAIVGGILTAWVDVNNRISRLEERLSANAALVAENSKGVSATFRELYTHKAALIHEGGHHRLIRLEDRVDDIDGRKRSSRRNRNGTIERSDEREH